ncbi:MAG TPA: aldo/keto reductase [Clostridiales bacterium]|nr:aldo/keto reductase [Clostridiales bacterium]
MEYRVLPKLNVSVSLLGYGCMRFPTKNGEIDEAEAEKLLDLAYSKGVNYFDTAYIYHSGKSESFVGKALSKYDRSSFYIADKLPCWEVKNLDDAQRIFYEQLERLRTDYIDFYLLHSLGKGTWKKMVELGVLEFCENLKKQGKIKYFGFSFHDEYSVFEEIITSREWDFCQIQLNYMDTEYQAGMKGYRLAEKLGVPVIIMEPLKGGMLATLPDEVTGELRQAKPGASVASWGFRWIGSLPNVKVVLSGMSTMQQLEDNLNTFGDFNPLNEEEYQMVEMLANSLKSRVNNGCTGCRYCMPCPAGVDIPQNFQIWNEYGIFKNRQSAVWRWENNIEEEEKAKNCISCGQCEEACPQSLNIRDDLKRLQEELDSLVKSS